MSSPPRAEASDGQDGRPLLAQWDVDEALRRSMERGGNGNDERSPLLSSNASSVGRPGNGAAAAKAVDETQTTKSMWYMTMLTISIGGLQIAWSVELSNGSPYLLSLGLSKSLMALVWIAGPMTGALVVPYVGVLSDHSRRPWGKRRPYMVGGTIATILGLLFLAWTREIVGGILSVFGADPASEGVKAVIIIAAVVGIYVLDIAINTVQAAIRAFMVDCAPAHQQELANAMASRLTGVGNIVGFIAGYIDLPAHLWFLGDTQFKILCAIACIALGVTITLSTLTIHERDPRADGSPAKRAPGFLPFFLTIFKSIKRLPPQTMRVCQVQFCAWVGFFPLLFYTSSYIGDIYIQPYLEENPHMTPEELDKLYEKATRVGTFALLINAIVSLCTNVFLPFFIAPTFDSQPVSAMTAPGHGAGTTAAADIDGRRHWLENLRIPGFTLKRAWLGSLALFAGAMFCTLFVRSVQGATALIGLAGVTWAMALWAPWAIISAEISRQNAINRAKKLQDMASQIDVPSPSPSSSNGESNHGAGRGAHADEEDEEETDRTGVILGIHNMAIAVPQILATVGSSIIFKFLQKPRGTPGDHSMAVVMALGGGFVLLSCFFAASVRDRPPELPEEVVVEEQLEAPGSAAPGH